MREFSTVIMRVKKIEKMFNIIIITLICVVIIREKIINPKMFIFAQMSAHEDFYQVKFPFY